MDKTYYSNKLNPYYGYWLKVNSIYNIESLVNNVGVNLSDNSLIFNEQDVFADTVKYSLDNLSYTFSTSDTVNAKITIIPYDP